MADKNDKDARDWRETLYLPKTDFPMKAGLPLREPEHLQRWADMDLYKKLRTASKGREKYVLHDGPPYANGNIHMGTALNKILKDIITRSHQMMGYDSDYVPGWDCHGLPIEWKIEEKYRQKQKNKDDVPIIAFRGECRDFASGWIDIQREEFKRLGVIGDWDNPYTTMAFDAEAVIADELMKFAMNGTLYQGSKPVMWSVVERTALAEAEIEYEEKQSPTIFVKFPIVENSGESLEMVDLVGEANVVIWTTTPWTIPGNRAIAFSSRINYGLYEVTKAADDNWSKVGEKLILADDLAESLREAGRIDEWSRIGDVNPADIADCHHPFRNDGYDFEVRLYEADFVTADTGTGFVHVAPGHGADDYNLYENNAASFAQAGIPEVPHTVRADGFYFDDVGIFGGDENVRVIDDKGKWGKANDRVIEELMKRNALVARGRIKHDYPHSWRSKKPVIFRNTPQWFIAIDEPLDGDAKDTIRARSLKAISDTKFTPPRGETRLRGMIENKPDWVISRQRAWGVPITVFVNSAGDYIPSGSFDKSDELIKRIINSFKEHGADAWFEDDAKEHYLEGLVDDPGAWAQVTDILDVWFDSGCTHAFCLEDGTSRGQWDLKWPADLYLEGSDQHRGWFHSSLIEGCGTRGRAPYDGVLTHGFVMAEDGRKMSKSLGNQVFPEKIIKQSGAEILRLWVASSDYAEDLRIGQKILKTNTDAYRKMRNTIRFLLGNLSHFDSDQTVAYKDMPELERYMLNRLHELDIVVREGYKSFNLKEIFSTLSNFCNLDLSAFYLDIRKDTLYCEAEDSLTRKAALTVMDEIFSHLTAWLAPIMCFTMEESWRSRHADADSVHLRLFPDVPDAWTNKELALKWRRIRKVRRVVTGALEVERREKRIGSSLEAAPIVYINDKELLEAFEGQNAADIFITSQAELKLEKANGEAFRLDDTKDIAVVPEKAQGNKCARSWKILPEVGSDPDYPDLTLRDAQAVRRFDKLKGL
ncbi:MAG: isoleucine--tRNA ligase [bacterium]|nr:isoleucine--tRNA ligase [bacterium]